MLLQGQIAIVTGAARGIGRACAERLAHEGARVVLADVEEDEGKTVCAGICAMGGEARYISADVSERLDVHNLVALTLDAFGRIDVLVNNAGVLDDAPFLDLDEAEFERVLDTNLKGAFLVAQAVAREMVKGRASAPERAPGAIVNMTSVNAWFGLPEHVAYAVSKGGLMQLTKSMALALAPYGIRVNAVGPGTVETQMIESVLKDRDLKRMALSRTPLGRFARPEEIAAVVAWLASAEASYLTGTTIWADGGRMPLNYTVPVRE
jgi:NAD(P)-dependent dehydrogenase (short-subunit alcohol dehydrogenase family)